MKHQLPYIISIVFFIVSSCKNDKKDVVNDKKEVYVKNYLEYTEDFSDQTWSKTKVIIKENLIQSPKKTLSADLLDLSIDSTQSRLAQIAVGLKKGFYTFSIYVKALPGQNGKHAIAAFSKGQNGVFKSVLASITDKEWTRVEVNISQDSSGDIIVYPGNMQIEGNKLNKVYIWGAQLEKKENSNTPIKPYSSRDAID